MSVIRWKKLPIDWKSPQKLTRLIDKTVWSCLFIAGAYLTGQMFVELVQEYTATTTDPSVKINKTMTLPPSALCKVIIIDTWEMSEKRLYNNVTRFFNRTDISKEEFLHSLSWPSYIIDAATNYLAAIESIITIFYESNLEDKEKYQPNIPLWEATHAFLLRHNITSMELQHKFGEEVRKSENLTVQFKVSRKTCEYANVYPRSSFLEVTPFSVRPNPTSDTFTKLSICWQFPFNEYELHADESNFFRLKLKSRMIYFIAFQRGNLYKYTPEVIIDANYQFIKETVDFSYNVNHKSLPFVNGITQCQTEEPSPRICINNCRATEFRKNCSFPMREHDDFSADNENIPSHPSSDRNFINYTACSNSLDRVQLEETCRKRCLSFCSISDLKLDIIDKEKVGFAQMPDHWELRIVIGSFNYVEMSERFLYTFTDFFAAAKGVFGFWLGLDATFLISLLFVPAMWLIEYCFKARNNGQQGQNNDSGSNLIAKYRYIAGLVKLLNIDFTGLTRAFLIKKIFEKLFWLLIYLLGSILTIFMCVRFYLNFRATQISFSITETSDNQMILPTATVCLPLLQVELGIPANMSWNDAYYAYHALNGDSIWGRTELDVNKTLTTIFKYDYQHINSMSMTKESLLDINERWPIELMRVARQYLILFGSFATMEIDDLRSTWLIEQPVNEHYNWEAIELLATKLDQLSINYDHLLQKFSTELQRYQSIDITKHKSINQSLVDYSLQVEKAAFITDKIICYWLPTEAISFSSPEEYINIHLNKTLLPGWLDTGAVTLDILSTISIRVPGRSTDLRIANQRELLVEVPMWKRLLTALNVARRFILLRNVENCTTETTLDECYAKCRISGIKVQCNCTWPAEGLDEGKKTS